MKRDSYYPRRLAERPEWHINFAAKLQIHGPTLNLTATQINNAVADNLTLAYGLGDWLTNVRDLGPTATASLKLLNKGTGTTPYAFPTYTAATPPTLPAGISRRWEVESRCTSLRVENLFYGGGDGGGLSGFFTRWMILGAGMKPPFP